MLTVKTSQISFKGQDSHIVRFQAVNADHMLKSVSKKFEIFEKVALSSVKNLKATIEVVKETSKALMIKDMSSEMT